MPGRPFSIWTLELATTVFWTASTPRPSKALQKPLLPPSFANISQEIARGALEAAESRKDTTRGVSATFHPTSMAIRVADRVVVAAGSDRSILLAIEGETIIEDLLMYAARYYLGIALEQLLCGNIRSLLTRVRVREYESYVAL